MIVLHTMKVVDVLLKLHPSGVQVVSCHLWEAKLRLLEGNIV